MSPSVPHLLNLANIRVTCEVVFGLESTITCYSHDAVSQLILKKLSHNKILKKTKATIIAWDLTHNMSLLLITPENAVVCAIALGKSD